MVKFLINILKSTPNMKMLHLYKTLFILIAGSLMCISLYTYTGWKPMKDNIIRDIPLPMRTAEKKIIINNLQGLL